MQPRDNLVLLRGRGWARQQDDLMLGVNKIEAKFPSSAVDPFRGHHYTCAFPSHQLRTATTSRLASMPFESHCHIDRSFSCSY